MKSILNRKKIYIYIRIFQIRKKKEKKKKKTKVGFEHWLIWSDYTIVVVSIASLTVTAKADAF